MREHNVINYKIHQFRIKNQQKLVAVMQKIKSLVSLFYNLTKTASNVN